MEKQIISISKEEITENMWDSAYGRHYLVITPEGEASVTWADNQRQWDPWSDEDFTASVPAIDPEGSGRESEDAQEFLRVMMSAEEFDAEDGFDDGYIEFAEKNFSDDWKINRQEVSDWTFDAFIAALNGDTVDLGYGCIWGYTQDEYGPEEKIEPPFHFTS